MKISWDWLIKLLASVLLPIIQAMSPAIIAALKEFLTDLYQKALNTPNPWDDFVIGLLLDFLGIPRPSSA